MRLPEALRDFTRCAIARRETLKWSHCKHITTLLFTEGAVSENQPKYLAEYIGNCNLPPQPKRFFSQSELFQCWEQAAGEKVAAQTENLNITNGLLEVQVNSPTWAHEVINRQTTILERLNKSGYRSLTSLSVGVYVRKPVQLKYERRTPRTQRTVTPEMLAVFKKIAKRSVNPAIKERFKRLSKIKP